MFRCSGYTPESVKSVGIFESKIKIDLDTYKKNNMNSGSANHSKKSRCWVLTNISFTLAAEKGSRSFGLIQPTLIQQLKKILDEYPDDGQILKVYKPP